MFSTPKLEELRCHKTRLKQPLLGAMTTPNFTPIYWTVVDKNVFSHINVPVGVTTFTRLNLYALITHHWKEL